jgi:hypothetical protein
MEFFYRFDFWLLTRIMRHINQSLLFEAMKLVKKYCLNGCDLIFLSLLQQYKNARVIFLTAPL